MNPASQGCGDSVEDKKGTTDESRTNNTTGWFWISEPAATRSKMRSSQSASSLQLFTIKAAASKPATDNISTTVGSHTGGGSRGVDGPTVTRESCNQEAPLNFNGEADRDTDKDITLPRRSVSLVDIASHSTAALVVDPEMARGGDGVMIASASDVANAGVATTTVTRKMEMKGALGDVGDITGKTDVGSQRFNHRVTKGHDKNNHDPKEQKENSTSSEMQGCSTDTILTKNKAISHLEEQLKKSSEAIKTVHKTNMEYRDEISRLTTTLEDEADMRHSLQEELESSRKLCCELYENLLQERARGRNTSRRTEEVERQLTPEQLQFSVSDAAVQTELNLGCKFSHHGSTCRAQIGTQTFIPDLRKTQDIKYDFKLAHLLEDYQESQQDLEKQLKILSAQCREKDDGLAEVKEKLGGHIRLNALLQSEKGCLEDTIVELREEVKSCDHLIQRCETVLREKDREIRELQEAKFELERQVAEYGYKESELRKMASGFQDDIGDLAAQRKKLRKSVKKSSKRRFEKQEIQDHKSKRSSLEQDLKTKAELLHAIKEVAFSDASKCTPYSMSVGPTSSTADPNVGRNPERPSWKDVTVSVKMNYTRQSVKQESVLMGKERAFVLTERCSRSVSQETLSTEASGDSLRKVEDAVRLGSGRRSVTGGSDGPKSVSYRWSRGGVNNGSAAAVPPLSEEPVRYSEDGGRNMREGVVSAGLEGDSSGCLEKGRMKQQSGRDSRRENQRRVDCPSNQEGVTQKERPILGSPVADGSCELFEGDDKDFEMTPSCHRLYDDVMNELQCKNVVEGMVNEGTYTVTSMEDVRPLGDKVSSRESLATAISEESLKNSQLMSSRDASLRNTKQGVTVKRAHPVTTRDRVRKMGSVKVEPVGARGCISDEDYSDGELKEGETYDRYSSNNSNDTHYSRENSMMPLEYQRSHPSGSTLEDMAAESHHSQRKDMVHNDVEFCIPREDSLQEVFVSPRDESECEAPSSVGDLEYTQEMSEGELEYTETEGSELDLTPVTDEDGEDQDEATEAKRLAQLVTRGNMQHGREFQDGLSGGRQMPLKLMRTMDADTTHRSLQDNPISAAMSNPQWQEDSERQGDMVVRNFQGQRERGVKAQSGQYLNDPEYLHREADARRGFRILNDDHQIHHERRHPPEAYDCEVQEGVRSTNQQRGLTGYTILTLEGSRGEEKQGPAEGLILRKQVMENYATRAKDRSWCYVYMVQDGRTLSFYLDRLGRELGEHHEPPIPLNEAIVSVAKDYYKRKHVFRLQFPSGQQYLLAARDDREMMYWVCRLAAASTPPPAPTPPPPQAPLYQHHHQRIHPALITTVPPPGNGSPTKSERLKNFIRGGISALRK